MAEADQAKIRVLVVDDEPDIRVLIKAVLEFDGRYTIVGQAKDGAEGIELATSLQPEVIVLDKSMPRLSGLDALPRIREVAPRATIVLYTAESDAHVHQAAVAGGAIGVVTKDGHITELAGVLSDALMNSWEGHTDLAVRMGPVSSDAALAWTENAGLILDAVRSHPDLTDRPVEARLLDLFQHYLDLWHQTAEASTEFVWSANTTAADVEDMLEAWASINRISDERLAELGLAWTDYPARLFFDALSEAVIDALERRDAHSSLAARLRRQFSE